ncbi:cysteine hydrolase [Agrobacterium sp. lyk4-40-TYG-31]|uniref:cysteine hydrolase n=1 Tax=Agrobacterium sp. lyk4-40-TYG-31 TaxID=3040276 RepID=UPI00254DB635|nr:cysteine hydrolase [Agrobacterium sp. lyk4-40-TYG-31]
MSFIDSIVAQAGYRRGGAPVYGKPDMGATAVLIMNLQLAWTAQDAPFRGLLPGQTRDFFTGIGDFAKLCRARGARIVWFRTTMGPSGSENYWSTYLDNFVGPDKRGGAAAALSPGNPMHGLDPEMPVHDQDWIVDKPRFDAFLQTDIEAKLRADGRRDLIVTGTATNICCESTVRSAMQRDFRTWMPLDLVSAPTEDGHIAGLRSVTQSFAETGASSELL